MDGISRITERILAKAREDSDIMIKQAESEKSSIQNQYKLKADREWKKIMEAARQEADKIICSSRSQASIEARNLKLSARHQILDKVFELAEEQMAALDRSSRKSFYEDIINACCSSGQAEVRLNKADTGQLGSSLKVKGIDIIIDKSPGRFSGGMILKEGDVEMDCTFSTMTKKTGKEMESEIAYELFSK